MQETTLEILNQTLNTYTCVTPATVVLDFSNFVFDEFIYKISCSFDDNSAEQSIQHENRIENGSLVVLPVTAQTIRHTFLSAGLYTITCDFYTIGRSTPYRLLSFLTAEAPIRLKDFEIVQTHSSGSTGQVFFALEAKLDSSISGRYIVPFKYTPYTDVFLMGTEGGKTLTTEDNIPISLGKIDLAATLEVDEVATIGCGSPIGEKSPGRYVYVYNPTDSQYGTVKIICTSRQGPTRFSISYVGGEKRYSGYVGSTVFNTRLLADNREEVTGTSHIFNVAVTARKENSELGIVIEAEALYSNVDFNIELECNLTT